MLTNYRILLTILMAIQPRALKTTQVYSKLHNVRRYIHVCVYYTPFPRLIKIQYTSKTSTTQNQWWQRFLKNGNYSIQVFWCGVFSNDGYELWGSSMVMHCTNLRSFIIQVEVPGVCVMHFSNMPVKLKQHSSYCVILKLQHLCCIVLP